MGSFSIWHWLIVLAIVALVFGTKKLRNIGEDLGGAVKGFKKGIKEASGDDAPAATDTLTQRVETGQTIDVQAREKADTSKA